MKRFFIAVIAIGFFPLTTTITKADIVSFSDDFNTTSSGDYTEGGFVGGNNGWISNTMPSSEDPFFTTDVAGTGLVEIVPGTSNFIDMGRSIDNFDIGQTVTIASTFNIGGTGSTFNNALGWNIGLGDSAFAIDYGIGVGGDSTDWYFQNLDNSNGNSDLSGDNTGPLQGLGRDTNQHVLSFTITKTATADTFEVEHFFDSTSLGSSTFTHSTLYNASELFLVGSAGGGGVNAVGGVDVDSFSITAIPEPSSLAVLGLLCGLVGLRRRK